MSFIKETEQYVLGVIKDLGYDINSVILEPCVRRDLGQFQINVSFSLAKKYHCSPIEIANKIVSNFDDRFINVNIVSGFINISFNDKILCDYFNKCFDNLDSLIDRDEPKTIIIDYGGANVAKALHVGHMRSANIGEALKRLCRILGHNVIGDVHLGDLGRQAGMVLSELMNREEYQVFFDPNYEGEYPKVNLTTTDLGIIYPTANKKAKEDPNRMELVRDITAKIDKGEKSYTALWKQIVDISSQSIKEVYKELNCYFDLWEGELDSFKYIPEVLNIMDSYLYESDGALVCDIHKDDDKKPVPPLIVIKKDGSTIYATRDLGTLLSRIVRFHPDEIWYVVDERQNLYFDQVFRGAYKTGIVPPTTKLVHYGFGTINGSDGKPFKTRDGGVMELSSLIEMIKAEISKKIKEEIKGDERQQICNKLSIATLKYTDLLSYRKTDYIFDPIKFSSLDGKTGPYILYTMVRIKSLLKKNASSNDIIKVIPNEICRDILIKILEIARVLKTSYEEATLNYITEYLYDLTSLYNKFYSSYNVLNESDLIIKESYIKVTKLVYNVCHNLLDILAIEEVDKM